MKKENIDSFEKSWRSAFEEAHLTPSAQLWEKIESNLPAQLPVNSPNTGYTGIAKIATSIVAIVGITALIFLQYKNKNQNLKVNHENSLQTKKPTNLGTKSNEQKLDESAPHITNIEPTIIKKITKQHLISIPDKPIINTESNSETEIGIIDNKIASIDEGVKHDNIIMVPLQNKAIKIEKVRFAPLDIVNSNEPNVPYFENTQPVDSNSKGKFWDNFKVRAGFGVGIGTGASNINKPKR